MRSVTVSNGHKIHRAGFIVLDADTIIENGYIETKDGIITNTGTGNPGQRHIDHGAGVLMPPLVNAHLHLELSALKDKVPFDRGFRNWVQHLLKTRDRLPESELIHVGRQQASLLFDTGNLIIADVSTLGIGQSIVKETGLKGLCFNEYLGSQLIESFQKTKKGLMDISYAGHAPHTTSPALLAQLKKQASMLKLPFSIHVAESDDETQFIFQKDGPWAQFLSSRGITDWKNWGIGGISPVSYLNQKKILGPGTIAVHLLNTNEDDLETIARTKTKICLCPRSNLNLHGRLPDIEKMLRAGLKPALGTDSLASCGSLNILDEMRFINEIYPDISVKDIFKMGTANGARALGMQHTSGTLHPGSNADFIYYDIKIPNKNNLLRKIITNE